MREEGIRLGEELFMEGKRWERMNLGDLGAGFGMKLVIRGGGANFKRMNGGARRDWAKA